MIMTTMTKTLSSWSTPFFSSVDMGFSGGAHPREMNAFSNRAHSQQQRTNIVVQYKKNQHPRSAAHNAQR